MLTRCWIVDHTKNHESHEFPRREAMNACRVTNSVSGQRSETSEPRLLRVPADSTELRQSVEG